MEEIAHKVVRSLALDERDRARWAAELHDETIQGLVAVQLTLGAAARSGSSREMEEATRIALERLEGEIESLRRVIGELRPMALDRYGLSAALQSLIQKHGHNGHRVQIDGQIELSPDAARRPDRVGASPENAAYRLIESALTMALARSGVQRVVVRVSEENGTLHAVVRDDGTDPPETEEADLALMRARADAVGGSMEVDSSADGEHEVRASIPLAASRRSSSQGDSGTEAA